MTQAKDLKSDLLSGLNDTMLDLGKRLEKAQNENDKIYFDKVQLSLSLTNSGSWIFS
jgi:hypothetical protein